MNRYRTPNGTLQVTDLILPHGAFTYKIRDMYTNIKTVSNATVASKVAGYSFSSGYSYGGSSK